MPAQLREAFSKVMENSAKAQPVTVDDPSKDEFFSADDLVPVKREAAERTLRRLLTELEELIRENKWEDVLALCAPVAEKHPELAGWGSGHDNMLIIMCLCSKNRCFQGLYRLFRPRKGPYRGRLPLGDDTLRHF
ncbi:MAG: hypothetical protein ACLFUL_13840 [Desulfobacteraceae bacterium]